MADSETPSAQTPRADRRTEFRVWKSALLAVTSASLGGIAVVLWHRRELQKIRQAEMEATPAARQNEEEFV